jgi:hypothetical protein
MQGTARTRPPAAATRTTAIAATGKIAPRQDAPGATAALGMPRASCLCAGDPGQAPGWASVRPGDP